MKYSENQEAGGHCSSIGPAGVFIPWLEAQKGYIIPLAPVTPNSVYTDNPARAIPGRINYGRNKGYAGPANQKAAGSLPVRRSRYLRQGDPVRRCRRRGAEAEADLQNIYGA